MGVKFNESFFQELSRSPEVEGLCVSIAQDIAQDVRDNGPTDTGDYVDGIEVRVKHQERSVALVVATDPKSLLIEAKQAPLVRALQRAKGRARG